MKRLLADKKRRVDICLIGALLLLSAVLYFVINGGRTAGGTAVVRVDGEITETHALSEDGEFSLNGGTNVLVIENGEAYMKDAVCPDKLCVKQGRIHYSGQCITCLPKHLTVTVEGGEENGVDMVS